MLIRTTCRDKWLDRQQAVEGARFVMPSARNPKVSYTGGNDGLRIFCRSIKSLFGVRWGHDKSN